MTPQRGSARLVGSQRVRQGPPNVAIVTLSHDEAQAAAKISCEGSPGRSTSRTSREGDRRRALVTLEPGENLLIGPEQPDADYAVLRLSIGDHVSPGPRFAWCASLRSATGGFWPRSARTRLFAGGLGVDGRSGRARTRGASTVCG